MPFQVSPGVNVSEIDLTTVVPAVSTTEGAIAGVFRWGPVNTRVLVDSESTLVSRFCKPTNHNPETFFTAANFLAYGNQLYVVRTADTTDATGANGVLSAYGNVAAVTTNTNLIVKNDALIDSNTVSAAITAETGVRYIARYPGSMGNSLKVSACDTPNAFFSSTILADNQGPNTYNVSGVFTAVVAQNGNNQVLVQIANGSANTVAQALVRLDVVRSLLNVNDLIELGNSTIGTQLLKVSSIATSVSNSTHASFIINCASKYTLSSIGLTTVANGATLSQGKLTRYWEYAFNVDSAPGTSAFTTNFGNSAAIDEVHVVVADEGGEFTGVPGTVLEVYKGLSRATNAKTDDGTSNYIKTVINQNSDYVYYANDRASEFSNPAANLASLAFTAPLSLSFSGGFDGLDEANVSINTLTAGYDMFVSPDDVSVALVMQGKARDGVANTQLANYIIQNICEVRKDCVAFISPCKTDVVLNAGQTEALNMVEFRNAITSSSYGFIDSGYKYQYDKYNDIYRYVPLNGDMAGLCVRTDETRDPWFSPAGYNRGIIKNVVKLAFNPNKTARDVLYKNGINPVVTFPGQGTLLFGDKTALSKPSAFDRINVRRLFIVLEKAIATAAKYSLFEFNDDITRAQFKNLVEPFLRDVQGRRGIYDFKVICDTTNNTGEVIDRNEFRGDIYIKPAKSINFIQLNFIAVRSGIEFSEIVGQF